LVPYSGLLTGLVWTSAMRRIEDKIRSLCTRVQATKEDSEVTPLLSELRDLLHQHIEKMRATLTIYPFGVERRTRDGIPKPINRDDRKDDSGTAA
jgi:hypothetical protein